MRLSSRWGSTLLTFFVLAASWVPAVSADVVTDWNTELLDTIRATRTNPPVATRAMAMLHTSIYDAVNGIAPQFESYHVPPGAPQGASDEAAAAAAGERVLSTLFASRAERFAELLATQLAAVPDGQAKNDGVNWGRQVADAILALRSTDGSQETVVYDAPVGSNWWVPTPPAFASPLLPQWPRITPWTLASGSQLRAPGPPLLTDDAYLAAFREVKELGRFDSSVRTADQSEIAQFWDDGAGTQTPPGHWNEIAQIVAEPRGLSLLENARLFALLGLTVADAAIVSWDNKYHYGHWRPVTGIVQAATDGNARTSPDALWGSFITTPPFPSHTSGHSTFSGSSSRILAHFFGTDAIAFTVGSDGLPGVVRSFNSLSDAAEEAGQSRIYGGIHWQYENRGGLASGRALADYVFLNFLRPLGQGNVPCTPSAQRLCLAGGRFGVTADWRVHPRGGQATRGDGLAVPVTDSSGSFAFFDPDNAEVLVKVLNACEFSDHFWVFASGATNVEYVLQVTDTQSGFSRTYFNPAGHMADSVLDTRAFATCP